MSEQPNPDGVNLALCELSLQACELKQVLLDLACSTYALITTLRENVPDFDETFDANRQAVRGQLREEVDTLNATRTSVERLRQKYSCRNEAPVVEQPPVAKRVFRSKVWPKQQ